ncbi:hypothetical protein [Intrasporangium sp.]|uniref:hypothetical protein n=1 Tax=Intrasporangium sp. TaxID=1925024 RepID=UPI003221C3C3
MGWFSRRKAARSEDATRSDGPQMEIDRRAVETYLAQFVQSHRGVEAYVEPPTSVTSTTVVLIAWDGEWTRRAVGSAKEAYELSERLGIPVYDVNKTGYPNRMREWNTRKRHGDA